MPPKGALIDPAVFGARERHAEMLQFINGGGRMAAEIFNGILVAQPVRPLHRVIHVPAPVIGPHVGKRGRNAALGRHRMRARGKNLRDAGRLQSGLGGAKRGAQARPARPHDNHIKSVIGYWIGCIDRHQLAKLIL